MMMVFKEFQGEMPFGGNHSVCIDIWNLIRGYHDTLIIIHT